MDARSTYLGSTKPGGRRILAFGATVSSRMKTHAWSGNDGYLHMHLPLVTVFESRSSMMAPQTSRIHTGIWTAQISEDLVAWPNPMAQFNCCANRHAEYGR